MLRIQSILLAFVVTFLSIGIKVDKHFCASFLHSVHIFSDFDPDSCCGEERENTNDGCCSTESEYYAFDEDYSFKSISFPEFKKLTDLKLAFFSVFKLIALEITEKSLVYINQNGPPLLSKPRIHLVNCIFLI